MEHVRLLDPLDVKARMEEFKSLKPGWLEGKGVPPPADGLAWLADCFERFYPDDVPLPYLYPTAEGAVRAEWPLGSWDVSLEIDLVARSGVWHALNLRDDTDASEEMTLRAAEDWGRLACEVRRIAQER